MKMLLGVINERVLITLVFLQYKALNSSERVNSWNINDQW